MANGFYLLLKTPLLSEVQVVDSLPLEEFSALPPSLYELHWGLLPPRSKGAIPLELLQL
jgi:hypothetical protein